MSMTPCHPPAARVIGLDSNVLIYFLEGLGAEGVTARAIVNGFATARSAGATCFITNDRQIKARAGVETILLSDITVPEDPGAVPMVDPAGADG